MNVISVRRISRWKSFGTFFPGCERGGEVVFEFHGDMNFFTLRKILEDRNEALRQILARGGLIGTEVERGKSAKKLEGS
jgi:hypothetical protein